MVEVFKTNIEESETAEEIIEELQQTLPGTKINFDLEDKDKVLRIAGNDFNINTAITLLSGKGYHCEVLQG